MFYFHCCMSRTYLVSPSTTYLVSTSINLPGFHFHVSVTYMVSSSIIYLVSPSITYLVSRLYVYNLPGFPVYNLPGFPVYNLPGFFPIFHFDLSFSWVVCFHDHDVSSSSLRLLHGLRTKPYLGDYEPGWSSSSESWVQISFSPSAKSDILQDLIV